MSMNIRKRRAIEQAAETLSQSVMAPDVSTDQARALIEGKRAALDAEATLRYRVHFWMAYGQACGVRYAGQIAERLKQAPVKTDPHSFKHRPVIAHEREGRELKRFDANVDYALTGMTCTPVAWRAACRSLRLHRAPFWRAYMLRQKGRFSLGARNEDTLLDRDAFNEARDEVDEFFTDLIHRVTPTVRRAPCYDEVFATLAIHDGRHDPIRMLIEAVNQGKYLHSMLLMKDADLVRSFVKLGCRTGPANGVFEGKSALEFAVAADQGASIAHMAAAGADIHACSSVSGLPLVALAAQALKPDALRALVDAGAHAHMTLPNGQTLLYQCLDLGWQNPNLLACVKVLLDAGVDPDIEVDPEWLVNSRNPVCPTARELACQLYPDIAELITRHGARATLDTGLTHAPAAGAAPNL